jgi:hypothetical protein
MQQPSFGRALGCSGSILDGGGSDPALHGIGDGGYPGGNGLPPAALQTATDCRGARGGTAPPQRPDGRANAGPVSGCPVRYLGCRVFRPAAIRRSGDHLLLLIPPGATTRASQDRPALRPEVGVAVAWLFRHQLRRPNQVTEGSDRRLGHPCQGTDTVKPGSGYIPSGALGIRGTTGPRDPNDGERYLGSATSKRREAEDTDRGPTRFFPPLPPPSPPSFVHLRSRAFLASTFARAHEVLA